MAKSALAVLLISTFAKPAPVVVVAAVVPAVNPVIAVLAEAPAKATTVLLPDLLTSEILPVASEVAVTLVESDTLLMAATILSLWVLASVPAATAPTLTPLMVRSPAVIAVNAVAAAPVTLAVLLVLVPSAELCALTRLLMEMVSPTLAPTWNAWLLKLPSSSLMPLKEVVDATRSISDLSCWTSLLSAVRSLTLLLALRDCTDKSRMRCRLLPISPRAPSAVCDIEMPSLALRAAWFRPLIWEVMRWEIAKPAASSLALLMRMPEDRRCR